MAKLETLKIWSSGTSNKIKGQFRLDVLKKLHLAKGVPFYLVTVRRFVSKIFHVKPANYTDEKQSPHALSCRIGQSFLSVSYSSKCLKLVDYYYSNSNPR